MGVSCKNSTVVVAMAVSLMLMFILMLLLILMLMHNCVEEADAGAASIEGEMELISFLSPSKSMALGLGEQGAKEFLF